MNRVLTPEILDGLETNDPLALASRRDLRSVNAVMQNVRWMSRLAKQQLDLTRPLRILDLGAGDGTFLLKLVGTFPKPENRSNAWLLDRRSSATRETLGQYRAMGWEAELIVAEALDWLGNRRGPVLDLIVANLFLHHLSDGPLRKLLESIATNANAFLACEPRRSRLALAACRLLWLIGCNAVTRHDALVSVKAGFSGGEISALWPQSNDWHTTETRRGLFSHCFVARRRGESAGRG